MQAISYNTTPVGDWFSKPFLNKQWDWLSHKLQNAFSLDPSLTLKGRKIKSAQDALPFFQFWRCLSSDQKRAIEAVLSKKNQAELQEWFRALLSEAKKQGIALDETFLKELSFDFFKQTNDVDKRIQHIAEREALLGRRNSEPHSVVFFFETILQGIISVLNALVQSTNLSESALQAHTIYEKAYAFDIVLKMIAIPFAIVSFLAPKGTSVFLRAGITGLIALCLSGFLYLYHRYLRPFPFELDNCSNLSQLAQKERIIPIGNEPLIEQILQHCNGSGTGFQQILLVGPSGSGKTTLMHQVGKRWKKGSVQMIDTPTFMNNSGYETYEKKWRRIEKDLQWQDKTRALFFLEELSAINEQKGKNFALWLNKLMDQHELRFVAALTDEEFKKMKEQHPTLANRFRVLQVQPWEENEIDAFLKAYWDSMGKEIPLKNPSEAFSVLKEAIKGDKKNRPWDLRLCKDLIDRFFDDYFSKLKGIQTSQAKTKSKNDRKMALLKDEQPQPEEIVSNEQEDLAWWNGLWQTLRKEYRALPKMEGLDPATKNQFLFLETVLLPAVEEKLREWKQFEATPDDIKTFLKAEHVSS